ncbi:MAG: hypothetical protein LBB48_03720 [Treponema sp.]|jgi:hypothetical protein|nr:hypothetical protein [Treponema sp.]
MTKKHALATFLLALATMAFAQTNPQIDVNIRFYDKKIYYVQGASSDPVYVQITIANKSPAPFYFKLADDRAFSIDFDVRTATNRPLPQTDYLIRKRTTVQQVFFRYVSIEPGEAFSFVEDVRDYAALSEAGTFIVQAKLYPDLYKPQFASTVQQASAAHLSPLASNRLPLNIRPPSIIGSDGLPVAMDVETNAILAREDLAPDNMIAYMLTARQKSQWEKFFLYMDVEAMVKRDETRKRQWLAESEEGRQRLTARYREELQNNVVDNDIVMIPMRFEIVRTNYGKDEGAVTVMEWFQIGNYIEKKQYVYTIQRKEDVWVVVNYTVQNMGTE